MTESVYKHSEGILFEVDTETDLTNATNLAILVKKPSNKSATWTAAVLGNATDGIMWYRTVSGDLDEDGNYLIQAYAEFPSNKVYYGNAVKLKVKDRFEV